MTQPIKILLADACKLLRWSLRTGLLKRHYAVCETRTKEVPVRLAAEPYDILILACNGEDPSHGQVIREARRLRPDLRVVVLSDLPWEQTDLQHYADDIYLFFEKPFELSRLFLAIDKIASPAGIPPLNTTP